MIDRQKLGGYDVSCDRCPEQEFFDVELWGELMSEMRSAGWRCEEVDGEWEHCCPACVEKEHDNDQDSPGLPDEAW